MADNTLHLLNSQPLLYQFSVEEMPPTVQYHSPPLNPVLTFGIGFAKKNAPGKHRKRLMAKRR